ncbi:MAG: BrnT family toxin [Elusimicrobia bacterium]|nr:BrnT family toxin [Elusimicrobiota bacterium]
MEFEFDERKSQTNKRKHGLDFIEARVLWDDPELLEIPLESEDEQRLLVIGLIDSKHWTAIITYRQTCVRIISVRRSRDDERELYES